MNPAQFREDCVTIAEHLKMPKGWRSLDFINHRIVQGPEYEQYLPGKQHTAEVTLDGITYIVIRDHLDIDKGLRDFARRLKEQKA